MSIRNLINSAKPASKTEAKKASTRIDRVEATTIAFKNIPDSGIEAEQLLQKSDDAYVTAGGKANLNEAFFNFNRTTEVYEILGLITSENNKIKKTEVFENLLILNLLQKPENKKEILNLSRALLEAELAAAKKEAEKKAKAEAEAKAKKEAEKKATK